MLWCTLRKFSTCTLIIFQYGRPSGIAKFLFFASILCTDTERNFLEQEPTWLSSFANGGMEGISYSNQMQNCGTSWLIIRKRLKIRI